MENQKTLVASNVNAFDILRYIGAFIVVFSHSCKHFGLEKPIWSLFFTDGATGVMMFFAMTGFVIMPAYERSVQKENSLRVFYWNRLIRLYPALWASFILITLVNASVIGVNIFRPGYLKYMFDYCILAKGGGFGDGLTNGVLWTIPADIIYYLLTPLIWKLLRDKKTWVWLLVIFAFWLLNVFDTRIISAASRIPVIGSRIMPSFPLFFIYEFLIGSFLYFKKDTILAWFMNHEAASYLCLVGFTVLFVFYRYTSISVLPQASGIHSPWLGLMACPLTIIMAYTLKPKRLKIDLSYGVFLNHMIVIGTAVFLGVQGITGVVIAVVITPVLAYLSARFIEKPLLKLKK